MEEAPRPGRVRRFGAAARSAARAFNDSPVVVAGARRVRELLPGDSRYGDPLSTAPDQAVMKRLSDLTAEQPGALREAGLSALQLWQAAAEAQGRGRGERELAIAFTDLEGFSTYALEAGDDAAVDLLREVGGVVEPVVKDHGGRVVKRLGDGLMAVFDDPAEALEALCGAGSDVEGLAVDGYVPRLRSGLHVGRPRRLAGDLFGVDVNIAARLADEASGGEVLVSDAVLERIDAGGFKVKRKRRFKVKGVPRDLSAHAVRRGS